MSALIGWALPYLLAAGAAVLGLWRVWASGKQSGRNQERASHAESRDKNLERIKRADAARPVGGVQDDPNNRDR